MSPPRRERPLGRSDIPADAMIDDEEPVTVDDIVIDPEPAAGPAVPSTNGAGGNGSSDGFRRLTEGIKALRVGGASLKWNERQLFWLAAIIAPLGLVLVFLGWYGAAHTPNLFEQVPYLISGGLLGLGLCFVGSFFYFAHWITELVREHRAQSAAIVEAITHLEDVVARTAVDRATAAGDAPTEAVPLVATSKGTMAHRRECVVVAGKSDVRAVSAEDGLLPCKLCDPYAESLN